MINYDYGRCLLVSDVQNIYHRDLYDANYESLRTLKQGTKFYWFPLHTNLLQTGCAHVLSDILEKTIYVNPKLLSTLISRQLTF